MTKLNSMTNLLDQLKVQVLLYAGTLIEYETNAETLSHLLITSVALKRARVDQLLLSVEREAERCGCGAMVSPLLVPIHTRPME